jgi:HEAT repeat protein
MTIEIADTIKSGSLAGKITVEGEQPPQLDTRLLGRAILELNISRKNFSIYPLGHSQITISIDRAYGLLSRLMDLRQELIIGVTKNHIFADKKQLDFKNPVYGEFSNALHSLDIAAVSFGNGLTKDEVFNFVKIISRSMEEGDGQCNIVSAMNEANIQHIQIETIDYDRFYLTEETDIVLSESTKKLKSTDIWHAFVGNLLSEQIFDKTRRDRLARMKPSEFACFLNERKIDPAIALQNYQKIFRENTQPEIKQQTDIRLDSLLKNLQPELRQQFLSITFDCVSSGSTEFLENYSNDMILEMLLQANAQHKQLSPSLITLLEKLSHTDGSMPMNSEMIGIVNSEANSGAVEENLRKLLEHEAYDNYVDDGYSAMLQRLSGGHSQSGQLHRKPPSKTDLSETDKQPLDPSDVLSIPESWADVFDEKYLHQHLGHMSLALMDQDLQIEDYKAFAGKLVSEAVNLLDIGAYDIVLMMIQSFQRHSRDKSSPVRLVAAESLQQLSVSDIVVKVLNVIQEGSNNQVGIASEILSAIGKSTIPGIMARYIEDESQIGCHALSGLLKDLGKDSLEKAYLRLNDSRIPVIRKILAFIREAGSDASIPYIRPLINHFDPLIRLDALSALLQLKDLNAADYLRHSLLSIDHKECFGAIELSGYYRVGEVAGDLSNLLIKTPWRKPDYRKNIEIIKALGRIGDPSVLSVLAKLIRKSLSIYPNDLRKMKIAFFESLIGYPQESLSQILKIGEKADDYRIRIICKNLS